ncbi:MAG: aminomethyl-transferring glycine dehydrogenase subunit GcvPA [Bacillota bacterium]|nr:aminomethyl-transferring glycine dehydrogenase subunit GcvPA [Bacillota bacterium]
MDKNLKVYPYMPNTVPEVRQEMLDRVGIKSVDELFAHIPEEIRFGDKELPLPERMASEQTLSRYITGMLKKNTSCDDFISFLGGGVAQHYIPAVCDTMVQKGEYLTTFMGHYCVDSGKYQVWWEFQSLICDLTGMEMMGWPAQEGATSTWSAILTAARVNAGRKEAVVAGNIDPDKMRNLKEVCRAKLDIKVSEIDHETGLIDIDNFKSLISENTACIYVENPTFFGGIDERYEDLAKYAHEKGAYVVVYVDPISLGLLETPKNYGADVICGELQSLGIRMQFGGGMSGFVATPFEEKWIVEYPYLALSRYKTVEEGEFGYASMNYETVSYNKREDAGDITSTCSALWSVAVACYLTLMGPEGLREVGETMAYKAAYAKKRLSEIEGVAIPFDAKCLKEFVVNFNDTGKTVKEINKALKEYKIFGGHDLSEGFPQFGQSALYCVTESRTKEEIDYLVDSLKEVLK